MTNADVAEVVTLAATKYGREIDAYEAAVYLGAQEILAADPDHAIARNVVKEFTAFMTTGAEPTSFDRFLLPIPYTDEEIAASEKRRADFIEIYRRYALVGIAEGDYAAAQAFKTKHNLTCEQIMAMTDSQIKALAA